VYYPKTMPLLYLSLAYSAVVLVTSVLALRGSRWATVAFVGFGLLFAFRPPLVDPRIDLPSLETQCWGLFAAFLILLKYPRYRSRLAFTLPVAVTLAAYGLGALAAFHWLASFDGLRAAYPFESMEGRVPVPDASLRMPAPTAAVSAELKELESSSDAGNWWGKKRASNLQDLHEKMVETFIDSPGFGRHRKLPLRESMLTGDLSHGKPVPQPKSTTSSNEPVETITPDRSAAIANDFRTLHRRSVVDFVNQEGFGYVKDRRKVAGFVPHGFSKVPDPAELWHVERVDLVSLLLHSEPVAYVSTDLPQMGEVRDGPTRSLDEFEMAGLEQIRRGEDLVVGESGSTLRVFGSVRSLAQCVKCHGGERGDLLGAFSYTLPKGSPNP
jgi:hypothetical protein